MRAGFVTASLVVAFAFANATAAQEIPTFVPFAPVSQEGALIEIALPGGPGAAANLSDSSRCSETKLRTGEVFLTWTPSSSGVAQRVDISRFRDGFETGTYETSGPLPQSRTATAIEGPEPGIRYYWRVLTSTGGVWASSLVERFEAPTCASDLTILPEGR